MSQGRVGALFALEVSRLSRSSADWYRLLELASLADVVIADEDVVYDPQDYNDRLLLGLKGQFCCKGSCSAGAAATACTLSSVTDAGSWMKQARRRASWFPVAHRASARSWSVPRLLATLRSS